MTEQTQSSADIATRALEEARAKMTPEEFRLFVYLFNAQYLYTKMQVSGFDPGTLQLFTDGLVQPLIYDHAEENGISEGRANDLREETRQVVIAAFSAAVVPTEPEEGAPNYPGVFGLIIDRARAEGFEAPTLEQLAQADLLKPTGVRIDWDAIYAAERFHFQAVLKRIIIGKTIIQPGFLKKVDA